MRRMLLSIGLLGSSALMPWSAAAFVTAEEMLDAGDFSTRFLDPPPYSPRGYAELAAQQAAADAARRAAAQETTSSRPAQTEVGTEETADAEMHPAAPTASTVTTEKDNAETARDARILERVKAQQEIDRLRAQLQWLRQTESLHSGAPLMSDTGPATVGAVLLLIGTVGIVLKRVRNIEKKHM